MPRKKTCSCGKIIDEGTKCSCRKVAKRNYMKEYQRQNKGDPLKTTRWTKMRKKILKRDKYLCQRCLHKYSELNSNELQVHHIRSRKNHPELMFDEDNLMTLCKTCNLQLGTSDKLDFEIRNKI